MIYFLSWHIQEATCCTNWAINIVRNKCVEETQQGGDNFITNDWWMSLQNSLKSQSLKWNVLQSNEDNNYTK